MQKKRMMEGTSKNSGERASKGKGKSKESRPTTASTREGGRRGRAGGRNPPAAATPAAPAPAPAAKSHDDPDTPNQLPPFNPRRQPGLHLNIPRVRGAVTRAVDFIRVFLLWSLLGKSAPTQTVMPGVLC